MNKVCQLDKSYKPCPLEIPSGFLVGRLSPYKTAKINALASKLAERYFFVLHGL
jgi:hypothetical protein